MGLFDFWKKNESAGLLEKGISDSAKAAPSPTAFEIDPHNYFSAYMHEDTTGSFHSGTNGLDYSTLLLMARQPVVSAIINTRINQVADFSQPQRSPYDLGFKIELKDYKKEPTPEQEKKIEELQKWMSTCGDDRIAFDNTFENFLRKIVRDSLIYDQCCFEIVRTRGGDISGFVAVDASTIRRARPSEKEKKQGRRDPQKTAFVQVMNNKTLATFTQRELCMGIRRPRTNVRVNGYGFPELEELSRVITYLINAEMYNANNFTHGMHTAGILAVKSKMNPQLFRAFRREFYSMLHGAENARRTPIIQLDPEAKEEVQSVNLSNSNKDMEYTQWMGWLLRLSCSIFAISPTELGGNWQYGNEGQTQALTSQAAGDKIITSKELGLRPLLRAVESWINRYVVDQIDSDFVFRFKGFDTVSETAKLDADIKSVKAFRTVNEIRAMYDLEPLDSPVADMVLDPTYINAVQQAEMMEQQGGEGEAFEEGGGFEEGDEQQDETMQAGPPIEQEPETEEGEGPQEASVEEGAGGDILQASLRQIRGGLK